MNIKLKKGPKEPVVDLQLDSPVTIETLLKQYEKELPYTILAAKVDNEVEELTTVLSEDCCEDTGGKFNLSVQPLPDLSESDLGCFGKRCSGGNTELSQ